MVVAVHLMFHFTFHFTKALEDLPKHLTGASSTSRSLALSDCRLFTEAILTRFIIPVHTYGRCCSCSFNLSLNSIAGMKKIFIPNQDHYRSAASLLPDLPNPYTSTSILHCTLHGHCYSGLYLMHKVTFSQERESY